jgi:hypothetical protein
MGGGESELLQGRGGGLGKYAGLTLSEIDDRLQRCAREPSMRSLSAALRITREQLLARGDLGTYPKLLGVFSALLAVMFVLAEFNSTVAQSRLQWGMALTFAIAALGVGVLATRKERRASLRQELEIKLLAIRTLEAIEAHPFPLRPLEREQVETLRTLLRLRPGSSIRRFLDSESQADPSS